MLEAVRNMSNVVSGKLLTKAAIFAVESTTIVSRLRHNKTLSPSIGVHSTALFHNVLRTTREKSTNETLKHI